MARLYELTASAFFNGEVKPPGPIVTLRDDEKPGAHMRPWSPPVAAAPPARPIIVDAMSGATIGAAPSAVITKAPAVPAEPPPPANPPGEPAYDMRPQPGDMSIAAGLEAALARAMAAARPTRRPGYLILDTETNGFKDPRLAAAAMIFVDADLNVEYEYKRLVRPDGWEMGEEAQQVHGLTMERLEREGGDVIDPLIVFELALAWGRTFVCHNAQFDLRVMRNEWAHAKRGAPGVPIPFLCTMLTCRSMLGTGKLTDAYEKLMSEPLIGNHDVMVDARACLEILRKLRERGFDIHQPETST